MEISRDLKRIYSMEDMCFRFVLNFRLNNGTTFLLGKIVFIERVKYLLKSGRLSDSCVYLAMNLDDLLSAAFTKGSWERDFAKVIISEVSEASLLSLVSAFYKGYRDRHIHAEILGLLEYPSWDVMDNWLIENLEKSSF